MTEQEKVQPDMKLEVVVLGVSDVDRAKKFYENLGWRCDIDIAAGVDISEVFHYVHPLNDVEKNPRISGRDPENRSYFTFASFEDPDGNGWRLQEIKERLPGREWKSTGKPTPDVATLADLLHETAEHHDHYEKTHAEHHWWDWYAAYLNARQNGSSPEDAAASAERYMEEYIHVPAR